MTRPAWHDRLEQLLSRFDAERGLVRKGDAHGVGHSSPVLAELLLRRNGPGDRDTAVAILEQVLARQHREDGPDQGRFPMLVPETWVDFNGTLFLVPRVLAIIEEHADLLPENLVRRLDDAMRLAAVAVERRWAEELFDVPRDFTAYSNVFVLYTQSLLLLGNHFGDERLLRTGEGQWRRWFNHVSTYGIDEFVSVNYNQIIFQALRRMQPAAPSPDVWGEMAMVMDHLCGLQYALHHPVLGLPISGVSRDYRRFVVPGEGAMPAINTGEAEAVAPPAVLEEYRNRQYPHEVTGRAGTVPFRFTSWQTPHAGLGSMTGGHYFPQQLHLIAAVGNSPTERAIAFITADRVNVVNGYVAQEGNRALCLFARTTTSYFHTQARQCIDRLPAPRTLPPSLGLVGNWTMTAEGETGITLRAFDHRLHIRPFAITDGHLHPALWREGTVRVRGREVRVLRGDQKATYVGCLVELCGPDEPEPVKASMLSASVDEHRLVVEEADGLRISLIRLPSGEFVQTYAEDWRALPLITSPAHKLWPGDLAADASQTPRRD